jgi:hypothetical protein
VNPRTTGLLLLVALALGAFVWFYEIQGEAGRKQAAAREQRLFPGLEASGIDSIELRTREGGQARLERSADGFRLVEPLAFPADSFAADGLASNLAGLEHEAVLEDPQPLAEYGLAEGARVVRFTAGEQIHELRLGDDTPVGGHAYASVEGRPEVFTVPRFAAQSFDKSLSDLRERRILDFDTASVRRVELSWPGQQVVLERVPPGAGAEALAEADEAALDEAEDGGVWRLLEPVEGPADDATVDQLLSDLAFLRAEGFVDDPPDAAAAGLDPPAFAATLSGPAPVEGAEATRVHIEIGGLHEGDQRLVRAAQPSLYTIPAERLEDLPRKLGTYRDRRLARFPAAEAGQVDLLLPADSGRSGRRDGRAAGRRLVVEPGEDCAGQDRASGGGALRPRGRGHPRGVPGRGAARVARAVTAEGRRDGVRPRGRDAAHVRRARGGRGSAGTGAAAAGGDPDRPGRGLRVDRGAAGPGLHRVPAPVRDGRCPSRKPRGAAQPLHRRRQGGPGSSGRGARCGRPAGVPEPEPGEPVAAPRPVKAERVGADTRGSGSAGGHHASDPHGAGSACGPVSRSAA